MCISWTNKELNTINMHGATTNIIIPCTSRPSGSSFPREIRPKFAARTPHLNTTHRDAVPETLFCNIKQWTSPVGKLSCRYHTSNSIPQKSHIAHINLADPDSRAV